jgi:hypothetical protein
MTTTNDDSTVTALRRPPVHASTLVRSNREHTFDMFVKTIGAWWPTKRASLGKEKVRDITIEPRGGGKVFETWDDGTTAEWGELLAWNPPAGLTMTWNGTPVPTEVELAFIELGPSLTRVTVEHRGWEALSDEQLAQDCGLPGGYLGGSYDIGWEQILDRLARRADHDAPTTEEGLPVITDEYMMATMQSRTRPYVLMMLKEGPRKDHPERDAIIWEHGRRNFALRASGVLAIVCPIPDDSQWCGIGLFDATEEEVARIMEADPAVVAGVFTFELHPVRSFAGDTLPT